MKKLYVIFALLLSLFVLSAPAHAFSPKLEFKRADLSFGIVPPHNEPIKNNFVSRYKIEGNVGVRYWRLTFDLNVKAWGLQDWRTPDVVGHGFPDAWEGSDWTVKAIRLDRNYVFGINVTEKVQLFVEHDQYSYVKGKPIDHAKEYYTITGVKITFK